jgi:hypothetical protein
MQTSDANQLLKENDLGICDDNTHINYQSTVGGKDHSDIDPSTSA